MRTALLPAAVLSALAVAACGGGDGGKPASKTPAASASSIHCLTLSVMRPSLYESAHDKGVEKGVRPLLTPGFKGGEILTGRLGGVVIEYPSTADAGRALEKANHTSALSEGGVGPPRLYGRTLFIDYTHEPLVLPVVRACGLHPDRPPPSPS